MVSGTFRVMYIALTLRSSSTQGPTKRPSTISERVPGSRSMLIRNTCRSPALPNKLDIETQQLSTDGPSNSAVSAFATDPAPLT
jgi:hypothetical protein